MQHPNIPNVSDISWRYVENLGQFWAKILIKRIKMKLLVSLESSYIQYSEKKIKIPVAVMRNLWFTAKTLPFFPHNFLFSFTLLKTMLKSFTQILHISDANWTKLFNWNHNFGHKIVHKKWTSYDDYHNSRLWESIFKRTFWLVFTPKITSK